MDRLKKFAKKLNVLDNAAEKFLERIKTMEVDHPGIADFDKEIKPIVDLIKDGDMSTNTELTQKFQKFPNIVKIINYATKGGKEKTGGFSVCYFSLIMTIVLGLLLLVTVFRSSYTKRNPRELVLHDDYEDLLSDDAFSPLAASSNRSSFGRSAVISEDKELARMLQRQENTRSRGNNDILKRTHSFIIVPLMLSAYRLFSNDESLFDEYKNAIHVKNMEYFANKKDHIPQWDKWVGEIGEQMQMVEPDSKQWRQIFIGHGKHIQNRHGVPQLYVESQLQDVVFNKWSENNIGEYTLFMQAANDSWDELFNPNAMGGSAIIGGGMLLQDYICIILSIIIIVLLLIFITCLVANYTSEEKNHRNHIIYNC